MTIKAQVLACCLRARGQVGKDTVFYVVNGGQRTRAYAVPTNPRTPAMEANRLLWKNGMVYWKAQAQSFRDTYIAKVKKSYRTMMGHNLFMRHYMRGDYP